MAGGHRHDRRHRHRPGSPPGRGTGTRCFPREPSGSPRRGNSTVLDTRSVGAGHVISCAWRRDRGRSAHASCRPRHGQARTAPFARRCCHSTSLPRLPHREHPARRSRGRIWLSGARSRSRAFRNAQAHRRVAALSSHRPDQVPQGPRSGQRPPPGPPGRKPRRNHPGLAGPHVSRKRVDQSSLPLPRPPRLRSRLATRSPRRRPHGVNDSPRNPRTCERPGRQDDVQGLLVSYEGVVHGMPRGVGKGAWGGACRVDGGEPFHRDATGSVCPATRGRCR